VRFDGRQTRVFVANPLDELNYTLAMITGKIDVRSFLHRGQGVRHGGRAPTISEKCPIVFGIVDIARQARLCPFERVRLVAVRWRRR
jgi:hypothetical protein